MSVKLAEIDRAPDATHAEVNFLKELEMHVNRGNTDSKIIVTEVSEMRVVYGAPKRCTCWLKLGRELDALIGNWICKYRRFCYL